MVTEQNGENSILKILLVEDNEHDQAAFRRALSNASFPYDIQSCVRAEDALERIFETDSTFNVLVTDFALPGMNGMDLCKAVMEKKFPIALIIVTGSGSEHVAVEALKAGVDDYLVKDPEQGYLKLIPIVIQEAALKVVNVQKRRLAESAFARLSCRQESLLEVIPDIVVEMDTQQRYQWVNRAGYDFFGEDVVGKDAGHYSEGKQDAYDKLKLFFSGNENSIYLENWERRKDGEKRLLAWRYRIFKDEHGNKEGAISTGRDITESRRTEEALRKSEDKYRDIFDNSPIGKSLTYASGKMFTNNTFPKMLGYSKDDFQNLKWRDITHPDDLELSQKVVDSFLSGEKEFDRFQKRYIHKNGSVVWADVSVRVRRNGEDAPLYMMTAINDITERKLAETALHEERMRLEGIIWGTGAGTWEWNVQSGETTFNERWAEIAGYSLKELSPVSIETWTTLSHPEDLKYSNELLEKHFRGELDDYECEVRMKHKNGSWIWVLDKGRVVTWTEDGKPLMMMGTHQDITDRKNAEKEIWEFNEQLQKVFDSQLDAIFVLDSQIPARVTSSNKSTSTIFGYEPEELQNTSTEKLHVDKYHLKEFQEVLNAAIRNEGCLRSFEFTMKRKDNSTFPSEHTVMELKDNTGVRTGWLSVVRDITERKNAEARLQQAQKMESIGNLAGGIAHDFNNILFPIVGLSEMLMEDLSPDSPEHENAMEIHKAGRRGSDLVKQILAFSRQSEQQKMPIRVQQILKEAMKLSRSTIPTNIEITQDIQSDCGMVQADPTQVHQIAMNLITNAYHAVESKNGKIAVRLKEVDIASEQLQESELMPGRYVLLSVSDTGIGIESAILNKIFEPYFTTKEQGKGTGLGLAVVYGIVKEHHGDIKVYSELGKGTTFNVYIPIMAKVGKFSSVEMKADSPTGHERILLVDDEGPILKLEKQMLERLGYTVTMRVNSVEALEAFKAKPDSFDMVISDMTMPQMTGDQLARELLSIRADIPIILCTGFSERLNQEKAVSIGVKGFLMKPIVKAEMAKMVRKVLDEAKSQNQA